MVCRKLKTMITGEHHILPGEIMMILMNIFGELDFGNFVHYNFFFDFNIFVWVSGHFIALNLVGHGAEVPLFFLSQLQDQRLATF